MKKTLTIIIVLTLAQQVIGCELNKSQSDIVVTLEQLAKTNGFEFVYGERFPSINPYGSYGSTYVFDFVDNKDIKHSVFFLARKKNKFFKQQDQYSAVDLIRYFDYYYIYAEMGSNSDEFAIKKIIDKGASLKGMALFYSKISLNNKKLFYIDDGKMLDPTAIERNKLSVPIIISSMSSTSVLYLYKGKWIEVLETEI
jgi:hypothetical protein